MSRFSGGRPEPIRWWTTRKRRSDISIDPDPYEFGGTEHQVRSYQRAFAALFRPPGPVLDVGCGRGTFLELLRERGVKAVGIDSSADALRICRNKGFEDLRLADAIGYLTNCPSESFAGIYCGHVIEHMTYGEGEAFLRASMAALQKEGKLIIVTPNPRDLQVIGEIFWLDTTHTRPYPLELLRSMVRRAGFTVVDGKCFSSSRPGLKSLPRYILLRLLLGKYYGLSNSYVVAKKSC